MGKGSLFKEKKLLDEKNTQFITTSKIPVGVFVDNKLDTIENVLFVIISVSDVFLFFYAKKLIRNSSVSISILDFNGIIEANFDLKEEVSSLEDISSNTVHFIQKKEFNENNLSNYELLISSIDTYDVFSETHEETSFKSLSLLLIRP